MFEYLISDAISDDRVVIVVTKFDEMYGPNNKLGDVATEDEVKDEVCRSIEKAAKVNISPKNVITLSGLWGLESRELLSPKCDMKLKEAAAFHLSTLPDEKRGQEESELMTLMSIHHKTLSEMLEKASNIKALEERYEKPSFFCIHHFVSHTLLYSQKYYWRSIWMSGKNRTDTESMPKIFQGLTVN